MSTPKAVVFDVGNVLLNWTPEEYFDARFGTDHRKAFFSAVPIEEANHRSDAGESLSAVLEELAVEYPDWAAEIAIWGDEWLQICSPAIEGSVRILEDLKSQRIPLFTLTNFGQETYEWAQDAYPFLSLFDRHFVSAELKLLKPDPDFYIALMVGTGFSGADIIFADDRLENIETAQSLGWQTYHFKSPEGWSAALTEAGIGVGG